MRIPTRKATMESKFDRWFACSWNNHSGTSKRKKANRKSLRLLIKRGKFD